MGRQVTADLVDLVAAGCTVRHETDTIPDDDFGALTHTWVVVVFRDGKEIGSCLDDCLNFDCRNRESPTFWALERLMDLGVPFTWA